MAKNMYFLFPTCNQRELCSFLIYAVICRSNNNKLAIVSEFFGLGMFGTEPSTFKSVLGQFRMVIFLTKCLSVFLPLFLSVQLLFPQNEKMQVGQTDIEEQGAYTIENITVSDGLHSNNIYDVLQDHLGFLWLASNNGLQKYDGYTFTFYSTDQSDSMFETVYGLYEDQRQNLWLQMETGISRYRRESDDFVRYYFVNSQNDSISYQVRSIAEDLTGALWVWIQDRGLYQLDPETKKFRPQRNVNKWFRSIERHEILNEGSRKGLYETWVTFMPGYYGLKLQYKFAIKRKNGTLEWEPNPNPPNSDHGNRVLFLTGDTLHLPVVQFNSAIMIDREILFESASKPSYVKFTVDLNHLENPPLEGEQVQLRGDIPPLYWGDEFWVNCIVFDLENKLWIGTDRGLFRFDPGTGEYDNFVANPGLSGSLSSGQITAALLDRDGDLWFGSSSGLNRLKPDSQTFETYFADPSNKSNPINGVHRLKDAGQGNIWTQSHLDNGGVSSFNKKTKKFTNYSAGFDLWFSSFTIDRSGIAWLGNEFRGLYKLNPKAKKFSSFSIKKNKRDILRGNVIRVFEDQGGKIWIGGYLDGLYRYNPQIGVSKFYKVDFEQADSPYSNRIQSIFQNRNGIFWIGTVLGLNKLDPNTGRSEIIDPQAGSYVDLNRTSHIHEDNRGLLWLLTRSGYLVHFNPSTYEAQFFTVFGNSDLDGQIEFCDLAEDPRGFFWIAAGNNKGLYKFDLARKKLSFVEETGQINIAAIYLDDNGILWCGTVRQGLIRYDTKTDTKTIIREKDGLLSNNIVGLEADQSGNLWLSTQKGLSRYNPQPGTFKHFFKEDGFFTDEFSYQAHAKRKNGELIFGSMHGVVTFHPDSIKDSDYIPPIVLTDFKINNKAISIGGNSPLKSHISVSDEITLTHAQNDLSLTFAALDFSHPERNRYSFYLENFEDIWRPPGLERTAYYTNLDPGDYVFRVKGTNSDGVWNEEATSIKITVLPPWWKTSWAYTFYAVVIGLILYGIRRFELKRTQLKNELEKKGFESRKLKEVDELKSRFFANISHEFRTPLTLILGPLEKLLDEDFPNPAKKQFQLMRRNVQRLQRLINQLLDLSKVEAGKMKLVATSGDIVKAVRTMVLAFSSLAESKDIDLKFDSSRDRIMAYLDPEKFEKIISNLLSNALKFTPEGGSVAVAVSSGDCVKIMVSDTGPGISADQLPHIFERFYQLDGSNTREQEGTGIGLALTKEFVELHHGEIRVDSEVGKGTTFTVSLPLGRKHLSDDEIAENADVERRPFVSEQESVLADEKDPWMETGDNSEDGHPVVLIVEDNHDMRRYISDSLADSYNILQAKDGQSGLQMAITEMPDLIVSDVMMPEMDGFALCEKLKTDERTSHIPVILLTARASRGSKIEGLETGADDYIVKPFDAEELNVRVQNLIQQREKLRERFQRQIIVQPNEITVNSMDEQFLKRALNVVEQNMSAARFNVQMFAQQMHMSRSQLNRKLGALSGFRANDFIRTLRLKRAAQLLQKRSATVLEIAYEVGFSNPSYFAECFRKEFGVLPSQFANDE